MPKKFSCLVFPVGVTSEIFSENKNLTQGFVQQLAHSKLVFFLEEETVEWVSQKEAIDSVDEKSFLKSEVGDQFSQCDLIEKYMEAPNRLVDYCPVELDSLVARDLIEMYRIYRSGFDCER